MVLTKNCGFRFRFDNYHSSIRNDLYCVEWGVKLYLLTYFMTVNTDRILIRLWMPSRSVAYSAEVALAQICDGGALLRGQ